MKNQLYRRYDNHGADTFQHFDYEKWMFRMAVLVDVAVVLLVFSAYFLI